MKVENSRPTGLFVGISHTCGLPLTFKLYFIFCRIYAGLHILSRPSRASKASRVTKIVIDRARTVEGVREFGFPAIVYGDHYGGIFREVT